MALDKIIQKARIHFYKPTQIAEVLYFARKDLAPVNPADPLTYRVASKRWRDEVSLRLVGRTSTSSARYQDDVFNDNAMPPRLLAVLDQENKSKDGIVENYIYHRFAKRLQDVKDGYEYLSHSSPQHFSLSGFLDFFEYRPGLKRSVDKAYEIVVYALFSALVEELKATVTLTLNNPDPEILADFALFAKYILGVDQENVTLTRPARIYRAGVANAADRGLDMWTNFGPAVQVKHLRPDAGRADDMAGEVATDDLVIVCKTAEARLIHSLLNQVGQPIRGIITQDDLIEWYALCLQKYRDRLGYKVLEHLRSEFLQEFPLIGVLGGMLTFMDERGYVTEQLSGIWQL